MSSINSGWKNYQGQLKRANVAAGRRHDWVMVHKTMELWAIVDLINAGRY